MHSPPQPLRACIKTTDFVRKIQLSVKVQCLSIIFLRGGSAVKILSVNARDVGLFPGLGRSHGEGNGYPLQCSCLENPWTEEPGGLQSMDSQRVRQVEDTFLTAVQSDPPHC